MGICNLGCNVFQYLLGFCCWLPIADYRLNLIYIKLRSNFILYNLLNEINRACVFGKKYAPTISSMVQINNIIRIPLLMLY